MKLVDQGTRDASVSNALASQFEAPSSSDPRLAKAMWLAWLLILIGAALRLQQYLANRSLSWDEASLVINLLEKIPSALLKPLDYNQAAPIGFLLLQKLMVVTFGTSEYALRFVPLLAGICSLPLFYAVARRCLTTRATLIALCLFVVSESLITYAAQVKQYSSDVAVGLTILLSALLLRPDHGRGWRLLLLGCVGVIGIWLSHPAVFILAGVGCTLIVSEIRQSQRPLLVGLVLVSLCWLLNFFTTYVLSLRHLIHNQTLLTLPDWENAFMPFPPSSLGDVKWYLSTLFGTFENPVRLQSTGLAAMAFTLGCVSLYRHNRRIVLLLVSPVLFALCASALHAYPYAGRLLLFTVPLFTIVIAAGIAFAWEESRTPVGLIMLVMLLVYPLVTAGRSVVRPPSKEGIKPVLNYVSQHLEKDDNLYLYYGAVTPFRYYTLTGQVRFDGVPVIKGTYSRENPSSAYAGDLARLNGQKRVWVVFSGGTDRADTQGLIFVLDHTGRRLDQFIRVGSYAYLYDLSIAGDVISSAMAKRADVIWYDEGWFHQEHDGEHAWRWMRDRATLRVFGNRSGQRDRLVEVKLRSSHNTRTLQVHAGDKILFEGAIPTSLTTVHFPLPAEPRDTTLAFVSKDGCERPSQIEGSRSLDARCLSFSVERITIERTVPKNSSQAS